MFRYDATKSESALRALESISSRLGPTMEQESRLPVHGRNLSLELVSMKESFNLELLTRFYNELMIPNFPLEEERDDLEDWVYCLDPSRVLINQQNEQQRHPSMDVILLIQSRKESTSTEDNSNLSRRTTIMAGIAFEYYKQAECGLLSYIVVSDDFRRLGIMRSLHPVACHAMQLLHQENSTTIGRSSNKDKETIPTIKAILAETNTPEAGDVPPAVIRKRHEILHKLGYRHLKFPYIQPALSEDMESFDEIILLLYSPNDTGHKSIGTKILYDYVVDFFQSVTGYDNDSYKNNWYYKLVEWFWRENSLTDIAQDLPWEDITQNMKECMAKSISSSISTNNSTEILNVGVGNQSVHVHTGFIQNQVIRSQPQIRTEGKHVIVIGAGIAGLVSTVTLVEEYLKNKRSVSKNNDQSPQRVPLTITLIEAQPFVGGRIRTIATKDTTSRKLMFSHDHLPNSRKVDGFVPWPVSIGAEFVHGVDSMANKLIEDHEEWLVHETFDLCQSQEEYPSRNSFVQRRSSFSLPEELRSSPHIQMFIDDQFYPMNNNHGHDGSKPLPSEIENNNIQRLVKRATLIWCNLQSISEELYGGKGINEEENCGKDISLDEFIEEQLSNEADNFTSDDVEKIKQILECLYSNTAGSSNKFLGTHEASREEWNWEYTESNFRLEECFNEFIKYYLDRIAEIRSNAGIEINIEINCPVSEIGCTPSLQIENGKMTDHPIQVLSRSGRAFTCDKCIVTIPLGVLKAKKVTFSGAYKIPRQMQEAIDTINFFSGLKAHMLLRVGVDIQHISKAMKNNELFFCPGEIFSQIWIRRNEKSVFLSGFCVANCRDEFIRIVENRQKVGEETKSKIAQDLMLDQVQRVFESMDNDDERIFVEQSLPTCSSFALHDWSDDEFTLGIYSSPSVGAGWREEAIDGVMQIVTHRDYLAKPINDGIWISGEHSNTTTCATVQSAMESGARAAKEVYLMLGLP